jgi:seryl-tRNA synthetase
MLFTDGTSATAGGTSDSTANSDAARGGGEKGDDKEALSRLGQQRDAARQALQDAERERDALKRQLDDLGNKDKSEMQRLQDAVTKLTNDLGERDANLRAMAVKTALTDAATKAGAKYPTLLVSELSGKVEISKAGDITNATELVADAKKTYPELFRVVDGGADGGKGRDDSSTNKTDMNRLLRRQAGYAG